MKIKIIKVRLKSLIVKVDDEGILDMSAVDKSTNEQSTVSVNRDSVNHKELRDRLDYDSKFNEAGIPHCTLVIKKGYVLNDYSEVFHSRGIEVYLHDKNRGAVKYIKVRQIERNVVKEFKRDSNMPRVSSSFPDPLFQILPPLVMGLKFPSLPPTSFIPEFAKKQT